ncbi:MAG: (2Fe-2S)-binding protein [Crocinitomicaceae bacterium]|nr:(2Fe-2S)-binding protein [Crocinitomicaceae bacterium]
MKRRKFIKTCCYSAIGIPLGATLLQSCEAIYYATTTKDANRLVVKKSEFWYTKKDKRVNRSFVLVKTESMEFPICLYKIDVDVYSASLLHCTHRGCELNVGGGIYGCPCHGSEFSVTGKVLEGPADRDLKTFKTEIDHENIFILRA